MLFTLINLIRDILVNVSCHVHFLFFVLSVILVIVCYCRLCSFFCMLCEDNDVLHILHWRLVCEYVMSFVFFLYCQVTVRAHATVLKVRGPKNLKDFFSSNLLRAITAGGLRGRCKPPLWSPGASPLEA